MYVKRIFSLSVFALLALFILSCTSTTTNTEVATVIETNYLEPVDSNPIISYVVDLSSSQLEMFWINDSNEIIKTFPRLKDLVTHRNQGLTFAMNGGMFTKEHAPLGLYIDQGHNKTPIKLSKTGYGNFYMQPNGVFYLTKDNKANVVTTQDFSANPSIKYATQSGPMLISNGLINNHFGEQSKSLHIRNGVGILPDGKVLFAISRERVNFYSFAKYFKSQGCKDALYLDGFVSKIYLPSQGIEQMTGQFGVIIGEVKPNH